MSVYKLWCYKYKTGRSRRERGHVQVDAGGEFDSMEDALEVTADRDHREHAHEIRVRGRRG